MFSCLKQNLPYLLTRAVARRRHVRAAPVAAVLRRCLVAPFAPPALLAAAGVRVGGARWRGRPESIARLVAGHGPHATVVQPALGQTVFENSSFVMQNSSFLIHNSSLKCRGRARVANFD